MTDWKQVAGATGLRVFPVRIAKTDGRWNKRPLIDAWQNAASEDVDDFNWARANGYGVLMGGGVYALDLDEYKEGSAGTQWLDKWGIPTNTRTHGTISGGRHLLYRLPEKWANLRTRANVVQGLDTRGAGGFIAFGEGYEVINDAPLALLPINVCVELARGSDDFGDIVLPAYDPSEPVALAAKFAQARVIEPRIDALMVLPDWDDERKDRSRSAHDMSMAALLAGLGWDVHEIAQVLLEVFPHGAAQRMKTRRWRERSALRCAVKVKASRDHKQSKRQRLALEIVKKDADERKAKRRNWTHKELLELARGKN